ncbi:class A beta-lactamase [Nocardioidaceae bacterium SCSIO 66511]|nr:class A beta-lactamase [Nocardioidaceae bacterium SCSIO 66511]
MPDSGQPTTTRRTLLRVGAAAPAAYAAANLVSSSPAAAKSRSNAFGDLERAYETTIGVVAWNVRTGKRITHRPDKRFAICSVFKAVVAAAVLRDHDRAGETLDRRVYYPHRDVLEYAPVTGEHVKDGMLVRELCEAAITLSDNTAGNLLLREVGGPRGLTAFVRSIGDRTTRLDRWEEALNTARPGDLRDTTTPRAIARTYKRLLVGDALNHRDRRQLREWMFANQTSRFADSLPDGWRLADKTGAGAYASTNDVGVAWNPAGEPIVIAALTRRDEQDAETPDGLFSDIAQVIVERLG